MAEIQSPSLFVHTLKTQNTAEDAKAFWICPYCSNSHWNPFQTEDDLIHHVTTRHPSRSKDRAQVAEDAKRALQKAVADKSSDATFGGTTTPDVGNLSLDPVKSRRRSPTSKKRSAGSDIHQTHRGKVASAHPQIYDTDYSEDLFKPFPQDRPISKVLSLSKQSPKSTVPQYSLSPEPETEWSLERIRGPRSLKSNVLPRIQHASSLRNHASTSHNHALPPLGSHSKKSPSLVEFPRHDIRFPGLLMQPDSRPISQDQLASEVRSIYTGLTMVENKCIEVDTAQKQALDDAEPGTLTRIQSDHWQALIALHRTLLHEHHDFFLASQHPSASSALRRLASKYRMPARMWKHGIHEFLELLRRNLPGSMDYMLAFIYLAYQMVALLYETVPSFEDTWIECLGDLGRYRMAIEDDDVRDRDTWASVSRSWYSRAADKNPAIGRLYHHLAILARSNPLLQLCYYCKSLTSFTIFKNARDSILTSLNPVLEATKSKSAGSLPVDTAFILAHAILFEKLSPKQFEDARHAFLDQLDSQIGSITAKWKEQGTYIAIINLAGLFNYGLKKSDLRKILKHNRKVSQKPLTLKDEAPSWSSDSDDTEVLYEDEIPARIDALEKDFTFSRAYSLTMATFSLALRRSGDKNVLPHVHIILAFLSSFATMPYVSKLIDRAPWAEIASFLNTLIKSEQPDHSFSESIFPLDQPDVVPLPDDYWIRGHLWSEAYFPRNWFARERDEDDRYLEPASTIKCRADRIVRIGLQISSFGRWMSYNQKSRSFSAS